jgi:hypothetical protein
MNNSLLLRAETFASAAVERDGSIAVQEMMGGAQKAVED